VRVKNPEEIDFSMKWSEKAGKEEKWFDVCRSKTLLAFHGVVLVAVLLIASLFYWAGK
jgi:hypothetical protein